MSPNFNKLYNLRSSNMDLSKLVDQAMLEASDHDTEQDKKQRFGAVPIYPSQYESDGANIREDDSDYAIDV